MQANTVLKMFQLLLHYVDENRIIHEMITIIIISINIGGLQNNFYYCFQLMNVKISFQISDLLCTFPIFTGFH